MKISINLLPLASLAAGLFTLPTTGLQAAILAYDGFDYETGSIITPSSTANGNGGTGWTSRWNSAADNPATVVTTDKNISYTAEGVTYGGGNAMSVSGANTVRAAERVFSPTVVTTGADIYFSFVIQITGGTAGEAVSGGFLSVSLFDTGFSAVQDNGITFSGANAGARVDNQTKNVTTALTYGTTYLVVGRFSGWDADSKTYQQTSVWLNPASDGFIDTPVGSIVTTSSYASVSTDTGVGSNGYRGVILRTNSLGSNVYIIDDIRIGTGWDDVVLTTVPEPATAAFLSALGVFGVAMITRRHFLSRNTAN